MNIKIYLLISFLICINLYSQEKKETIKWNLKKDFSEIIQLVYDELKRDTIPVYYRFDNREIFSTLEDEFLDRENKIYEKNDSIGDEITLKKDLEKLKNPFLFVKLPIVNIETYYYHAVNLSQTTHQKKINKFSPNKYVKDNAKRPLSFISIPLISIDKKKAIIYCTYICGRLCGSILIYEFEYINGKWSFKKSYPISIM